MKKVGFIAILYALSMLIQNAVFAVSGAPGYGDPINLVYTYHTNNQGALSIAFGLEMTNMVLLLFFIATLHSLVKRRGVHGEDWSRLAMIAGSALSVLFALTIATHIAVVLAATVLSEPNTAFQMIWQLHAAAFALSLPALGVTFIGTALAAHASDLIKTWQKLFGMLGGILPILAGIGNLAIAGGSSIIYIGVMGLFMWIFWLLIIGVRFIRE